MVTGGAAGPRGPGQRSSLVGSCGAESSRWCAERFSVPGAVRPSHSPRRPGPVRACVSAPAPRGRCNGRKAAASGEGASRRQGGIGVSWNGSEGPSPARVHWLIQNPQSRGALSISTEPPPEPGAPSSRGPVRFGFWEEVRGLTVPERAESGFPHVAPRRVRVQDAGAPGCGWGGRCRVAGLYHLWRSENPGETWRLARRDARRSFAVERRGREAA